MWRFSADFADAKSDREDCINVAILGRFLPYAKRAKEDLHQCDDRHYLHTHISLFPGNKGLYQMNWRRLFRMWHHHNNFYRHRILANILLDISQLLCLHRHYLHTPIPLSPGNKGLYWMGLLRLLRMWQRLFS